MKRLQGSVRAAATVVAVILGNPCGVSAGAAMGPAGAAPRRVMLDASDCPTVAEPAIRRIVGIEIGDLLIETGRPVPASSDRLVISCDEDRARVRASGSGRQQRIDRTLRLGDFPGDAAPRALALAGIEVLAAFSPDVRQRIQARQNPPVPRVPMAVLAKAEFRTTPPPASAPRPSTPSRPWSRLGVSGVRRRFLAADGLSAWGGRIDFDHDVGIRWMFGFDLELATGNQPAMFGGATLGSTTGTLASSAGVVGVRAGGPILTGVFALGGRMGVARLDGVPVGGMVVAGAPVLRPWGGPLVSARALLGRGSVGVRVDAEVGLDVASAQGLANGATVLAVRGPWLALSVGAGIRF